MRNLKLKLFEFKKHLTVDQEEVGYIIDAHMRQMDNYSEKEIISSLNEQLDSYSYYTDVKSLITELNSDMQSNNLLYELKDVYRKMERNNLGELYRQPLQVLLEIINTGDNNVRMEKIVNELAQYDWIPEIRGLMFQLSDKHRERYSNGGGHVEPVLSVAMKVSEGFMVLIKEHWFLLTDKSVGITQLEKHISDEGELKKYRLLEEAVKNADITENKIVFNLDENLSLGLSIDKPGKMFINDEEADSSTTLESLFQSPIVPFVNRNYYPVILETSQNLDKFVIVDVVNRAYNVTNPYLECYAFNYKDNIYVYRCDERYGNTLYKYESATKAVADIAKELDCNLTKFYENKLPAEAKKLQTLEDNEMKIKSKIDSIEEAIAELSNYPELQKHNDLLKKAETALLKERHKYLELQKTNRAMKNILINETGEWEDDAEGMAMIADMKSTLKQIQQQTDGKLIFLHAHGFDKYQGAYGVVSIHGEQYKVWYVGNSENAPNTLWIEGYPVDNTSDEHNKGGFKGTPEEIIDMLNTGEQE